MDRTEKILHLCNIKGKGLEIGPSFSPVVSKKDGYDVETIDHLDKEGLINKYSNIGIDTSKVEEVDYVWNGETYTELTGKADHYDYIIASHVIEHVCCLISTLNDISNLLKYDGTLSLVVPDKRYTLDYFRPSTDIQKVIDCYLSGSKTIHSPGTVLSHYLNVCKNGEFAAWSRDMPVRNVSIFEPFNKARDFFNLSLNSEEYIDAHSWVFTQASFELLMYDLNCLGYTNLRVVKTLSSVDNEFYVSLQKKREQIVSDNEVRLKLLLTIAEEPREESQLLSEINYLKRELDKLHNSNSWKITRPLRALRQIFSGDKKKK